MYKSGKNVCLVAAVSILLTVGFQLKAEEWKADFKNPQLPAWIVPDKSGWKVEKGVLRSRDNAKGGSATLTLGKDEWSDYTLSFKMRRYSASSGDQHWGIILPGGKLTLYTRGIGFAVRGHGIDRGAGKIITPSIPCGPETKFDSYTFTLKNNIAELNRNGEVVAKVSKLPYQTGKLGFYFYRNSVEFSELALSGETAPPPDPSANWLDVTDKDVAKIEAALNNGHYGLAHPVSDRKFWDRYQVNEWVRSRAEIWLAAKIPAPVQKNNLDFSRAVCTMTVMEAKENRGRFLPKLAEYLMAWVKQEPWTGRLPIKFKVDLTSARKIRDLSEAWWILHEKLPPEVNAAIEKGIEKWCLEPMRKAYAARSAFDVSELSWLTATSNWNPFCQIGVLNAADVFLDKHERAVFYTNAVASLQVYRDAFGKDGYIVEGAGYFDMGFSRYLDCAEVLRRGTGGKLDLLKPDPTLNLIMLYPRRYAMDKNLYPHFADYGTDGNPEGISPWLLAQIDYLSGKRNYGEEWGDGWPCGHGVFLCEDIGRTLLAEKIGKADLSKEDAVPPTTFFSGPQVVVCRDIGRKTGRFAFAAKGGTNHEDHNHNDLGSFCLSYNDRIILGDPGCPIYSMEYFTGKRYSWKLASSYGHPVPVINGCHQPAGDANTQVKEFRENGDEVTLTLDLTSAYPAEANLKKLERTFIFRRDRRTLTITDRFEFRSPGEFAGALVSYQKFRPAGDGRYETDNLEITISSGVSPIKYAIQELPKSNRGKLVPWRLEYRLDHRVLKGEAIAKIVLKKQ
ncbi:MAG: heparinase II/III family protein [Victivallaceae bacterium]|nr:heparinase II/III family protein [Victivallaceae bacterium]